jgi:hypothetical protein
LLRLWPRPPRPWPWKPGQGQGLSHLFWPRPPPPPDPDAISSEEIDAAFRLDHFGDGDLIKRLFRGRFLLDNLTEGKREDIEHVYEFVGSHWAPDSGRRFEDGLRLLGDLYERRAFELFQQAAAQFLPPQPPDQPPEPLNLIRRLRARSKDKDLATEELIQLVKRGDGLLARADKCRARPRLRHAAASAFAGVDALGLAGPWNRLVDCLPCANGTVDLATGRLRATRP